MRQATVPSNSVGVAMNSVSVLKPRAVGSRAVDRQSHERGDGEPACRPISMLSFLETENIRLRQAVVELHRATMLIREALRKNDGPESRREASTPTNRRPCPSRRHCLYAHRRKA